MKDNKNIYDNIFNAFKEVDRDIVLIPKELLSDQLASKAPSDKSENETIKIIKYKGKTYSAKITEKLPHFEYTKNLRGPHINRRIYKILETKYKDKKYYLVIKETQLYNLREICTQMHEEKNILKLIYNPFFEVFGNYLLKYLIKEIIKGLETFERNELVHYDLKSENILILSGLKLKISNSHLLINLRQYKGNELQLPKEIKGYIGPEYFIVKNFDKETVKKVDYFALGATLLLLKVGDQMLTYKDKNDQLSEDRVIDLLQRDINYLRTNSFFNVEFSKFVCELISYSPEERPSFEEIYRNEWLNKDYNDILPIANGFLEEEEEDIKMIKELVKADFCLEKQKDIDKNQKNRKNFTFCE